MNPPPLWELVRELRRRAKLTQSTDALQAYTIKKLTEAHAVELEAALRAWDVRAKEAGIAGLSMEEILGVPDK